MCLNYIPWGEFWQGAWKGLKTHPLSPVVLASCHWERTTPQVPLVLTIDSVSTRPLFDLVVVGLYIVISFDLLVRYRHLSNCQRACPSLALVIQMTKSILSSHPEPAVTAMRYVCCNNTVV